MKKNEVFALFVGYYLPHILLICVNFRKYAFSYTLLCCSSQTSCQNLLLAKGPPPPCLHPLILASVKRSALKLLKNELLARMGGGDHAHFAE